MKRKIGLLLLLCIAVLLAGCTTGREPAEEEIPELLEPVGVELDFARVEYTDLYTVRMFDSGVVPYTEPLCFTIDGTVLEASAYIGKHVKAGEVLVTLDEKDLLDEQERISEQLSYLEAHYANIDEDAQLDIRIAELRLEQARSGNSDEATLTRLQNDIDMQKLHLRQAQEDRKNTLSSLREELDRVEAKLGQNTLVAPFDGTIVYMPQLRKGYGVGAYNTVLRIADDSRLSLSGEYITPTSIESAHSVYALIGSKRYELQYEPMDMNEYYSIVFGGGTATTQFSFAGEHDDVTAGEYAAICIESGYRGHVLVIPFNAFYTDSIGKYVYKLENGNRVRTAIRTGASNSLYIEVTEGLEEGDLVYVKE